MTNNAPPAQALPSRRSILSAVVAIALALYATLSFTHLKVIWNPAYYGVFGLTVDGVVGPFVNNLVLGSPADMAGIRLGDRVDRPRSLRDRLALTDMIAPRQGERMTLSVHRGSHRRILTLVASPFKRLTVIDSLLFLLKHISMLVYVVVGLVLVMLRPTKMTWGFYLIAIDVVLTLGDDRFFTYAPLAWLVQMLDRIIFPAGIAGFLIFCSRFPQNAPTGWRNTIDALAPYVFFALAAIAVADYVLHVAFWWPAQLVLMLDYAAPLSILACFVVGTLSLMITYFGARGLDRQRLNWVALGVLFTLVASAFDLIGPPQFASPPSLVARALDLLYVPLPLAIAYAVIRHRVIDVRFVASRALAIGVIGFVVTAIVVGIDWLFSIRLPNSRLETAAYALVALLVGFSLNAARQRVGKSIDFVFFRQWHRTQEEATKIADALRRATSAFGAYELLTTRVASVFSIASAALFERAEDGGFVRVAARGWPAGTIWHILPDDPLVVPVGKERRLVDIDAVQWQEPDLPSGVARPAVLLPIIVGKRVPAVLLLGAHENGTALDPDEIRTIRDLCADASLLYSRLPAHEHGRTALQPESLGA